MKDCFRKMRKVLRLTQEELEDILEVRSSKEKKSSAVPKWEGRKVKPSAEVLEKLSQKLKVNISWLLTSDGEMFLPDAPVPVPRDDPATRGDVGDLRKDIRTGVTDLRACLADISRKLDTLVQLPGEATQKKEPVPDNVVYFEDYIRSLTARQRNHFIDETVIEMNYPIDAGEVRVDEYSRESDWVVGPIAVKFPDKVEENTFFEKWRATHRRSCGR